jgi:hypothetical protein
MIGYCMGELFDHLPRFDPGMKFLGMASRNYWRVEPHSVPPKRVFYGPCDHRAPFVILVLLLSSVVCFSHFRGIFSMTLVIWLVCTIHDINRQSGLMTKRQVKWGVACGGLDTGIMDTFLTWFTQSNGWPLVVAASMSWRVRLNHSTNPSHTFPWFLMVTAVNLLADTTGVELPIHVSQGSFEGHLSCTTVVLQSLGVYVSFAQVSMDHGLDTDSRARRTPLRRPCRPRRFCVRCWNMRTVEPFLDPTTD